MTPLNPFWLQSILENAMNDLLDQATPGMVGSVSQ